MYYNYERERKYYKIIFGWENNVQSTKKLYKTINKQQETINKIITRKILALSMSQKGLRNIFKGNK